METILADIHQALKVKAYYAGLMATLTLPELCGRCEQEEISRSKGKAAGLNVYKRWASTYLVDCPVDGVDLYYLRNGLAHYGRSSHHSRPNRRFIFTTPETDISVHGIEFRRYAPQDLICIDLFEFYNDMRNATLSWCQAQKDSQTARENMSELLQPRRTQIFGGERFILG